MSEHTHDHDHNCDCGCDCGDDAIVTLTLDDGSEVECAVMAIFPVGKEEQLYIALLPLNENGDNEDGEIYLYRYTELEGEEIQLDNIEDDDEYEAVADAFDELLDDEEFDNLMGD